MNRTTRAVWWRLADRTRRARPVLFAFSLGASLAAVLAYGPANIWR